MVTTNVFERRATLERYELNELWSEVCHIIAHGLPSFADVLGRWRRAGRRGDG